jgi:hypothetical protein
MAATKQVLGRDIYIPNPISSKLKDGTRVIRIIGRSPYFPGSLRRYTDGTIRLQTGKEGEHELEVTEAMANGERDDLDYHKWEWRLLHRGPRLIEKELQAELERREQPNIKVTIGDNGAYPTSIAFRLMEKPDPPRRGPPLELALLFSSLPRAGEPWPASERRRWHQTAAAMFDLMYGPEPGPEP